MSAKEKTAQEMFEELGYKYKYMPNSHYISYYLDTDDEMHFTGNSIKFMKKYKKVVLDGYFNMYDLQAINKQVEELGWDK
jgi:hypothetical protein